MSMQVSFMCKILLLLLYIYIYSISLNCLGVFVFRYDIHGICMVPYVYHMFSI
jgi:hypothetical protein